MAVSVFKSSSKRGTYASPSITSSSTRDRPIEDSGKKIPLRRSRSIVSSPRSNENSTSKDSKHFLDYANTRDNPLFDCTSSSPSSPEAECLSEAMKSDVLDCRKGRSLVKNSNFGSESICSSTRERSSSRDIVRQSRIWSLSRGQSHISKDCHWEERNSRDYFSETESSMRNVIKRKVPGDSIDNVLPELVDDQDEIELVPDIQREYTFMLEQSQERISKLQADLAFEEQRQQELSRILNNIVLEPKISSTHKSKIRRKASIERLKMSRRLAEEAMTYFDECVSLSAFDGSDFSSQEDHQINSTLGSISTRNSRFLSNGCSSYAVSDYPITQFEHHEGLDNDNRPSHSSSVSSDSTIINHRIDRTVDLVHHNGGDDLPEFYIPRRGNSYFQHGDEHTGSLGLYEIRNEHIGSIGDHEIRNYFKNLEKSAKSIESVKEESTYIAKDYSSNPPDESLLFEKVTFRNRINFGGMLVCSINTF